jgi:hypothetical protein
MGWQLSILPERAAPCHRPRKTTKRPRGALSSRKLRARQDASSTMAYGDGLRVPRHRARHCEHGSAMSGKQNPGAGASQHQPEFIGMWCVTANLSPGRRAPVGRLPRAASPRRAVSAPEEFAERAGLIAGPPQAPLRSGTEWRKHNPRLGAGAWSTASAANLQRETLFAPNKFNPKLSHFGRRSERADISL